MIRVKDAEKSLKWYQDVLGMSRVRTMENTEAGFNLYFLGYSGDSLTEDTQIPSREGLLELTWNYGTEKDENFKYHNGNDEPQGFGHLCKSSISDVALHVACAGLTQTGISVDNIDAACERFESLNVNWKKRLTDGRMKNVAFLLDPDGYWVEVVQNERFTGKDNF